ncbi:MAG: hypothetical protein CL943_00275 [Candidatus Diapherotrites archaeon]|uniref:YbaK/aminoacyl-tRNA synthetase-associated domain-containing protein n=1 Tax=Candidatus Iainarchaeum sp. TaxID=3101447 RepID=A0A2D6LZW8_9ARCH|nr:hypothetical protein [Candidatus Diapherotrites archaeon]|tara:strand:- start:7929 stop:8324 length:396 start_codon:yes stop_codon:yes gene_type:complete
MLDDFIKSNGLKAKILQGTIKSDLVRCRIFAGKKEDVLIISLRANTLDYPKMQALVGVVEPLEEEQVKETTGYKKEFLPPISIYGLRVLIDKKVLEKESVHCILSHEKTLEISPQEIKDFNDDVEVVDITK